MNKFLKVFFIFLNPIFLLLICSGMILNPTFVEESSFLILSYIGVGVGIFAIVLFIVLLIKDFDGTLAKRSFKILNYYNQDFFFLKFIRKHPAYIIPFFLSLLLIVLYFLNEIFFHTVYNLFKFDLVINIILYVYLNIFITISIYMLGYLTIGEIFQRKYSKPKRLFIVDIIIDYICAIPFIIILTLFFLIFLLLSQTGKKSKEGSFNINLQSFSVYLIFLISKYFTYLNLASIAYEDERFITSIKKTVTIFKENIKDIVMIFAKNGMIFLYPIFISLLLFVWSPSLKINTDFLLMFIGFLFGIFFLYRMFSEQIILLIYYVNNIKNKGEIKDFEDLFKQNEEKTL